jgi:hypothetical protein
MSTGIFKLNSYANAFMNMTADVYTQTNIQSQSGSVKRKWSYDRTISCKAMVVKDDGGKGIIDDKQFKPGSQGYQENMHIKLQCTVRLSKRFRVTGIKTSDGESAFVEADTMSLSDTIFDVISTHPVLDPFGKISYYEINLRRAQVQNNDIIAI